MNLDVSFLDLSQTYVVSVKEPYLTIYFPPYSALGHVLLIELQYLIQAVKALYRPNLLRLLNQSLAMYFLL